MKSCVLLPVKSAAAAKQRMSPLFNAEERAVLVTAMLEDVAAALGAVEAPVVLVTNSSGARKVAEDRRWRLIWETNPISESASVDAASQLLAREGMERILRLPADIPLVRAADIDALLQAPLDEGSALLVPSFDGSGTNALLRQPPCLFPSRFGPGSRLLHIQEALRAGATILDLENPRIALDLDEPSDVSRFMSLESQTRTHSLLHGLGITERMAQHAGR